MRLLGGNGVSAPSDPVVAVEQEPSFLPRDDSATANSSQLRAVRLFLLLKEYPSRARELLAYLVLFLLIYSVCYLIPYGFYDDYANLYTAETAGGRGDLAGPVENARPILGYLFDWTFAAMHDLSDLRYLRLVSVIGIALCAWLVYLLLRRAGLSYWPAFFVPVMIFTLPTYQVFASWSLCAFHACAILLAGAAFILTERALGAPFTKRFWLLLPLAALLELASMMIYQPAAMTLLLFGAITIFVRQLSVVQSMKCLGAYLGVIAVAIGLDDASLHTLPRIILGVNITASRTQLVQNIPGKIGWFFRQPLNNALNLTSITPTYATGAIIGAFIIAGLFLYFEGSIGSRLAKLVLALFLLPISYLPNLITIDNWAAYRTLVALGSLIVLYYALAFMGFARLLDYVSLPQVKGAVITIPLAVLAISGGVFAAHNVALDFAVPQYTELELLNSQLQPVIQQHPRVIYFVASNWTDSIAPVVCYDEFGVPSSDASWNSIPMVYLALQEIDPADDHVLVKVISEDSIKNLPTGSVVVNMQDLQNERSVMPFYCSTT